MKSIDFSLKNGLSMAFSRLQVWFDPAQEGSPYETFLPKNDKAGKKRYPLFIKKLSIRI
jgi:hypothetical protein